MRHGWPSHAQSAGWPPRGGRAGYHALHTLLAHATGAFIDRTPIDWSALLSRVRTSPDRALFENLYALSAMRGKARAAAAGATESHASAAAWVVVAIGSVETVLLLGLLASALIMGESIGDRTPQ